MTFDKRQTNIAKGIAALLLLWHHVFYNSATITDNFIPLAYVGSVALESFISGFCKVCVAIFCVLTGLGLFRSFSSFSANNLCDGKLPIKKQCGFIKNHLLNMMSKYWFVFIFFAALGFVIGKSRFSVYNGSVVSIIIDFFGLADLFGTPTLNATWWFMYMIIIFYILFPIIYRLFSFSAELVLALSLTLVVMPRLPVVHELQKYQLCFVIGMYIAKYNLFERVALRLNTMFKRLAVCILTVAAIAYTRMNLFLGSKFDAFFAVALILTSFFIVSQIPFLNKVLEEIGKHSAVIFMSHTFIYLYYFKNYIYWFRYSPIIFIVLTVVSYAVAKLLDFIMNVTRYKKFFDRLTSTKKSKA